jgi:branched-chain amino acid transport system substrate-binding protein
MLAIRTGLVLALAAGLAASPTAAEVLVATSSPMTGRFAWYGEQWQRGAELAVGDLNARGGVLGERLSLTLGDDACDPVQAPLLARSLVARRVAVVIGPACSEAALAAAPVCEEGGAVMISPSASNPALTERGWQRIFRVFGRDDLQGRIAADRLAAERAGRPIGIVYVEDVYSRGLALEARRRLDELAVPVALVLAVDRAAPDWDAVVDRLAGARVELLYTTARAADAGVLVRRAAARGLRLAVVGGDTLNSEDFWLTAGAAGEGTRFTSGPDPRTFASSRDLVERFRASGFEPAGYTLYVYAALEAWAQAVARAGSLDAAAVAAALRAAPADTVLGRIGFDGKGDVTGIEPFQWFVWSGGAYRPLAATGG